MDPSAFDLDTRVRLAPFDFLAQDESQPLLREKRIKAMPLRVLALRGVVRQRKEL